MADGNKYLAETFAASGIDHFFHVPVVIPNALREMQTVGVRPIVAHAEKAAAYMADGYARASGRVGACGAQQIGAANLAAGLLDAYMAHSPVLAITGGTHADTIDRNYYQEVDQRPLFAGVTKTAARVEALWRLPDTLGQVMRVATTGAAGPVHLELSGRTGSVLNEEMKSPAPIDTGFAASPAYRQPAPSDAVAKAAALLAKASKPLVIAGSGIRISQAQEALAAFVRAWELPLATSLDAKAALPESDPLNAGVCGTYSRETTNKLAYEADLILFVGSTTGSMTTTDWTCPTPGVATIQIDVDPRELGRNYPLQVGLAGDPATVLAQLTDHASDPAPRAAWLKRVEADRASFRETYRDVEFSDASPIRPETLFRIASEELPAGGLITLDTGHTGAWGARHVYLDKPGQNVLRAAGSLGWSYPAALGAKCAQPDRPVISLTGDGGFYYHLGEMETSVRYGINTVTIVNNNMAFSQERNLWQNHSDCDHHWLFAPVDLSKVAEGFGVKAYRIDKPADLAPAIRSALQHNGPVLIEVVGDVGVMQPPAWKPGA